MPSESNKNARFLSVAGVAVPDYEVLRLLFNFASAADLPFFEHDAIVVILVSFIAYVPLINYAWTDCANFVVDPEADEGKSRSHVHMEVADCSVGEVNHFSNRHN